MRVEFNALPRAVRERWIEAARDPRKFGGMAAISNQLREVGANRLYWLLLVAGAIGTFFASRGIDADMAPAAIALTAAGVGLCGLLLLSLPLRGRKWEEAYVFPGCIVFARGRQLEILTYDRMPSLPTEVTVKRGGAMVNKYARIDISWWHQLNIIGPVDESIGRYNYGRLMYGAALGTNDTAVLMSMNPLYELCHVSGWKPGPAEAGGPRIGGLGTWPARALTFVLVPALAITAVTMWHTKARDARLAREAAYVESKGAWKKTILAAAATPAAEAMFRQMCEQRGTNFLVGPTEIPSDTLRALDDSARADKALGPSEIFKDAWDADPFVEVVKPRFKSIFTGWDTTTGEGASVSFTALQQAPEKDEIITIALEASRSGDAMTISASGASSAGSRIGGSSSNPSRGNGRCIPLAFRGAVVASGVGPEPVRVPVDIPAMTTDAIQQGVSRAVDKGNLRPAAQICYQVQIRHAFEQAGRAFIGGVFRGDPAPAASSSM